MAVKEQIIKALAEYYAIDENSCDWEMGATILGDDGEYRWLTLNNVVEALEEVIEEIEYNLN